MVLWSGFSILPLIIGFTMVPIGKMILTIMIMMIIMTMTTMIMRMVMIMVKNPDLISIQIFLFQVLPR